MALGAFVQSTGWALVVGCVFIEGRSFVWAVRSSIPRGFLAAGTENVRTCGHGRVPGTLEAWHHRVVGWLKNMSNHGSELKDHATMVYLEIHDLDTAKLAFTTATAKVG